MARSLLPLFTLVSLYFFGLEAPTSELIKAVSLTAVGCGISAYGEVGVCVCVCARARVLCWDPSE